MEDGDPTANGTSLKALGDRIVEGLLSEAGVEPGRSRFADREALFFRGKEFFHLDEPGLADVRVGRAAIRARAEEFRSDPAIELRSGASDWVQARFASVADAERVLRLARSALQG